MLNSREQIKNNERLLDIRNLRIWYNTYAGYAKVVNGIDFYVNRGERVGLVGESGCGKTTVMKTILQVLGKTRTHIPDGGLILFKGEDILKMKQNRLQEIRRRDIAMISQEPMAALNPVFTIGQQLYDIIVYSGHFEKRVSKKQVREIACNAIKSVMISDPERILDSYPHQLSGGMRQRICIASALVTPRDLLIADEPGTALDVTIQAQIHRLLRELTTGKKSSLIMITHSLGVARELVDRIYVMYAGNIVENSPAKDLFSNPRHPYTKGLLDCVPRLSGGGLSEGIYGYVPDYVNSDLGCRFFPRCAKATEKCAKERPPMREISPGQTVACFLYDD